ncbi:MAG: glycosyltransferase, partial [Lachnospiraceae bacterium]|nr:glycosyltransferase [Lachnospiraceae bacterium]
MKFEPHCSSEIVMICVSSCLNWHGYDRVIEGLRIYYETFHDIVVKLNLVGDGPELKHYKELASEYKLEPYVVFYGNLYGLKLDEVYLNSHVALDAMGRHRVG